MKKYTAVPVIALWLALTLGAWFSPANALSEAERRPLAQRPAVSGEALLSGTFMADFEDYSLDQFPLRDAFRQIKTRFHYFVLGQMDNNGIYLAKGHVVKQEYPLSEVSVNHALNRFQYLYETYFSGSNVYAAVVPDKGYYLAEESGHLAMDYETMFRMVREGMPWASFIDLTDTLSAADYYRTDTHWRQERLLETAGKICDSLGVTAPRESDFTRTALDRPFYGVYRGQVALPLEPDTIYLLESPLLEDCIVYDYETGEIGTVYDRSKLDSRDLYDVYLSGARSLLTIENPNASTGRELIVFRDSFGSSLVPLLLRDYATVTLVDIRYIRSDLLDRFLDFSGQDVLLLYSTLVLNNSASLK